MPTPSQSVYELRRIKNSTDRSLREALKIYFQNVDPLIRTNTNEIIHWLDRYNEKFQDRFYIVALHLNDSMIGYGQFTYFKEEKLVFIDYMAIEKNSRKNNTFYEFVDKVKDFFINEDVEYNYIVTEVGYYKDGKELTEVGRNLIRLLKMTGFGVIKMNYFQPMLGKKNYETEIGGVLMIYTENGSKTLKLETFLQIIDTIYYKNYKRWYDDFLNEQEQLEYGSRLLELRERIRLFAKKKPEIEINGYVHLTPVNLAPTPSSNYIRLAKVLSVFIIFTILSVGIGGLVLWLRKKYNIDGSYISFISVCSLVIIIFISRVFYKNKNESISGVIEKIFNIFN
ncbi:MAG TPA: hypothetical protein VK622_05785 [Puia sp.]|nr:hypothetical protein [Puia sp.]HTE27524.1 hypothetical protein [Flavitalea sp.]